MPSFINSLWMRRWCFNPHLLLSNPFFIVVPLKYVEFVICHRREIIMRSLFSCWVSWDASKTFINVKTFRVTCHMSKNDEKWTRTRKMIMYQSKFHTRLNGNDRFCFLLWLEQIEKLHFISTSTKARHVEWVSYLNFITDLRFCVGEEISFMISDCYVCFWTTLTTKTYSILNFISRFCQKLFYSPCISVNYECCRNRQGDETW